MAINLTTKYSAQIENAYTHDSYLKSPIARQTWR